MPWFRDRHPAHADPWRVAVGPQLGDLRPTTSASAASPCRRRSGRASRRRRRAPRATPTSSPALASTEIVDHYARPDPTSSTQPPVLIGHSYGGRSSSCCSTAASAARASRMSPAPPKGILVLPFSSLKAASPALAHPSKRHGVVHADARGVHLRLREHVLARGGGGGLRALRGPGDRARSSTRPASRTSTCTRRPRCISRTPSARRC